MHQFVQLIVQLRHSTEMAQIMVNQVSHLQRLIYSEGRVNVVSKKVVCYFGMFVYKMRGILKGNSHNCQSYLHLFKGIFTGMSRMGGGGRA